MRRWLAEHERYHVHFTPPHAFWLNQVEIWFGISTRKAIRRGSFRAVRALVDKTQRFTEAYKTTACPFVWTATAESILQKLERLCFNTTPVRVGGQPEVELAGYDVRHRDQSGE